MKFKKILLSLLIISIFLAFTDFVTVFATDIDSILNEMNSVRDLTADQSGVTDGINTIYTLVRIIGSGVSVIMVLILAIKYMTTSVESKAEIKKQAVPLLVGAFFIFATSNLLKIVIEFVKT